MYTYGINSKFSRNKSLYILCFNVDISRDNDDDDDDEEETMTTMMMLMTKMSK